MNALHCVWLCGGSGTESRWRQHGTEPFRWSGVIRSGDNQVHYWEKKNIKTSLYFLIQRSWVPCTVCTASTAATQFCTVLFLGFTFEVTITFITGSVPTSWGTSLRLQILRNKPEKGGKKYVKNIMNTFFKRANKNKKKPFLKSEKIFKKSFISVFDSHRQEKRQKK